MAAIGLVVIGWRRLSMTQTVVLFFFFALAAYRAGSMLNQYDEARVAAWEALGAPETCSGTIRPITLPSGRGEWVGFVAEALHLECEGPAQARPGPCMRLYAPFVSLARGHGM